jgi:ubiquinone/menaquinone biosynthesis C-methylase UbiE
LIRPQRERAPELMDGAEVDPSELARSLTDLQEVNRWLGGARAALDALVPLLRPDGARELRVLDVGTGSADIPLALSAWAREAGRPLRVVATDVHPGTLAVARQRAAHDPGVQVEVADALDLPYADGAFDVAMCHTALHHFDPAGAVRVLVELGRVATRGVVVSDLYRSWVGLAAARLLALTVWRRHPVTRHDGPVSVRAAFTPAEMRALAAEAGLRVTRLRTYFFFNRMTMVATREAGHA